MFDFEEKMDQVAHLVDGVDNDPANWSSATELTLLNAYGYSAFFSLDLRRLKRRCDRIVTLVRELDLLNPDGLNRGPLTSAVAGEAVTLRQLVKINHALGALAKADHPEARQVLSVTGKNQRRRLFAMGDNSVIMSMHWINSHMLRSLRKSRGLSKREMSQLMLGPSGVSVFGWLEDGAKQGKKDYQYRVTQPMAEYAYRGFELIYTLIPEVENLDHEAEDVAILTVLPEFSDFFDPRHTAGLQNGKRTLALPVSLGNLLSAPSATELRAQESRIKAFAATRAA